MALADETITELELITPEVEVDVSVTQVATPINIFNPVESVAFKPVSVYEPVDLDSLGRIKTLTDLDEAIHERFMKFGKFLGTSYISSQISTNKYYQFLGLIAAPYTLSPKVLGQYIKHIKAFLDIVLKPLALSNPSEYVFLSDGITEFEFELKVLSLRFDKLTHKAKREQ
jgi:hypothetical protein